tara:strand:+ start:1154 stop:1585 length:432 start_codon:yes stop_codon:yes gene_type:complete
MGESGGLIDSAFVALLWVGKRNHSIEPHQILGHLQGQPDEPRQLVCLLRLRTAHSLDLYYRFHSEEFRLVWIHPYPVDYDCIEFTSTPQTEADIFPRRNTMRIVPPFNEFPSTSVMDGSNKKMERGGRIETAILELEGSLFWF